MKNFSANLGSIWPGELHLSMSYFDLLLAVPLLWGAVRGFMKGFIISVSGLLALIVGVYGAILFSDQVGVYLQEEHGFEGPMMPMIAFALVFLAIVVGIYFLGRILEKVVKLAALGLVDKLAGGLFGLAKAALIVSVILLLVEQADHYFEFIPQDEVQASVLYEPISDITQEYFPKIADSQAFQQMIESAKEMQRDVEGALEK